MPSARYLDLFVSDAREQLAALEAATLRLEQTTEAGPLLDAMFRALHSLKSSAAVMGFDPMVSLAHRAESLVSLHRGLARAASPEAIDLFVRTVDGLGRMLDAVLGAQPLRALPELDAALVKAMTAFEQPPAFTPPRTTEEPRAPFERPTEPHTLVTLTVSSGSAAPAARAFLALRRLGTLAPILFSEPSLEALRAGRLPENRVRLALAGDITEEALEAAVARTPDIERVAIDGSLFEPAPHPPLEEPVPEVPTVSTFVRVRAELLDHLLELAGELLLSGSRMRELVRPLPASARAGLEEETDRLRVLVRELNNEVLAARQAPIARLADRLPRAVHDLARRLGKHIHLSIEGADLTADRGLLEALVSPMLHVVRNAADHGLESPAERLALGKPEAGRFLFRARREREHVLIELHDDGRGFDLQALREKAVRTGHLSEEAAATLDEAATLRLAFLPGLSTRETASEFSGRGVGLDAVARSVEQLGGTMQLESRPGLGSVVRFVLPASRSVSNVLLVALGEEIFALPMSRVVGATTAASDTRLLEGGTPAFALGRLLGLPERSHPGERAYVVLDAEGHRAAVGVDGLLGQEEVVLRPLSPPLERLRGLAGTAILGSGRPVFVLDVPQLLS